MQPYFLPYIGYFQLIAAVDLFVVYDNIKYTKKGWINRNRMLVNGRDSTFSLSLKGASDGLEVAQRELATDFSPEKLMRQFEGAYAHAPEFAHTQPLLETVLGAAERNLFGFLLNSLQATCAHLGLATPFIVSSTVPIDHGLRGQDKVLALCETLGATTYINTMGGRVLYSRDEFARRGIELQFIGPRSLEYSQFGAPFVPWLSIIDVLMFNPRARVRDWIDQHYELV